MTFVPKLEQAGIVYKKGRNVGSCPGVDGRLLVGK